MKNNRREEELFPVLTHFYTDLGYYVDGEVSHCDMLVEGDDSIFVIELKMELNLRLIIQATERQKLFEAVYVAIPADKVKPRQKEFTAKINLLKRLGIGLIAVETTTKQVSVIHHPLPISREKQLKAHHKKRERVVAEFQKRWLANGCGGTFQKKVLTVFRQRSLLLLSCLQEDKTMRELVEMGFNRKDFYPILYQNHLGWFEKKGRAQYGLSEKGRKIFEEEQSIIHALSEKYFLEN